MSDTLKKFVTEHRPEFDTREPGKDLWEKIDAQLNVKNASRTSSKWLSKFKYLGFSACVLVVAMFFLRRSLTHSSANEKVPNEKDSVLNNSEQRPEAYQNKSGLNVGEHKTMKEVTELPGTKNKPRNPIPVSAAAEQGIRSGSDSLLNRKKDSVLNAKPVETIISADEKKQIILAGKKTAIYIPEDIEKMNSYSGTVYDASSLCEVVKAYKFPGKIKMNGDRNRSKLGSKETLRTISCNLLENTTNIKAVWLKGKTNKNVMISLEEGFKNIVLVKSDGREVSPEAISHYYPGVGVITGYTGKGLNMIFKDKVELILFFKDVEEGDKIVIGGTIEAVVKGKP